MSNSLKDKLVNAVLIVVVIVAVTLMAVGIYNAFFRPSGEQIAVTTRDRNILACNKALAKSLIVVDFMKTAAETRRSTAASDYTAGRKIDAANNIAAAEKYETYASQYDTLTIKDCEAYYKLG